MSTTKSFNNALAIKPEVGKQYKFPGYRAHIVGTCIFVGKMSAVFLTSDGHEHVWQNDFDGEQNNGREWTGISEYREPVTITEYVNVYKRPNGSLMFGSLCRRESEAMAMQRQTGLAFLATIPVTFTEPQS